MYKQSKYNYFSAISSKSSRKVEVDLLNPFVLKYALASFNFSANILAYRVFIVLWEIIWLRKNFLSNLKKYA